MKFDLSQWGPATVLTVLLTVAAAIIGGIVVLTEENLTFQEYLTAMAGFAIANGVLAVGRGIGNAGRARAAAEAGVVPPATANPPTTRKR